MCLSRRLHVLLLFLSHFSLILLSFSSSAVFSPSCLPFCHTLVLFFSLSLSLSLSLSFLFGSTVAAVRHDTACNGLKGLHSNNRETNCRALARYRASPVGRPRLAARAKPAPALVYHRSFCYGDMPLFSPRFRDSFTLLSLSP